MVVIVQARTLHDDLMESQKHTLTRKQGNLWLASLPFSDLGPFPDLQAFVITATDNKSSCPKPELSIDCQCPIPA